MNARTDSTTIIAYTRISNALVSLTICPWPAWTIVIWISWLCQHPSSSWIHGILSVTF